MNMQFYIGKNKDLTRVIIARLFWQSLMDYTKPYGVALPEHIQN